MDIIRSRQFGQLVDDAMQVQGLTQAEVAWKIGLDPETGRPLGETQVARIRHGQKEMNRWLVDRLTEVLGLDPIKVLEATTGHKVDTIREMLDARIAAVAEGDSEFAARQAARRQRRRRSTPPGAATAFAAIGSLAASWLSHKLGGTHDHAATAALLVSLPGERTTPQVSPQVANVAWGEAA